ncbi:MAG: HAD family hydrolase [Candidatus Zipacnadales bacterium]
MKIVFCDIDRTLMFDLYVAPQTIQLIEQIRSVAPFALITARSFMSVQTYVPPIPHDYIILENGCVISHGEEGTDQAWDTRIRPFLPIIERYKARLNLKLRPKTRMISIGITENGLTQADIERIAREIPPELVLRTSSNERGDFLEIYPAVAGKANAIRYVANKLGVAMENTCALGDDLVDIEMLEICGYPVSHEGARKSVRELVQSRGGYVSPFTGHEASADMLQRVLRWLGG